MGNLSPSLNRTLGDPGTLANALNGPISQGRPVTVASTIVWDQLEFGRDVEDIPKYSGLCSQRPMSMAAQT